MIHRRTALRLFRGTLLVVCVLLVVQYVLGMLANLDVQIPANLTNGNAWRWAYTNSPLIQTHVLTGTLLLVLSLAALVLGSVARSTPAVIVAVVGLVMMLVAYLAGVSFLSSGQQSASSLWMSLGFLGALLAYFVGWGVTRPARADAVS